MKYYLAGPMAGIPEYNWPLFKHVTKHLRSIGMEIYCATESGGNPNKTYIESLKLSLIHLLKCDNILLLPDWSKSRGATLECLLAFLLRYTLHEVSIIHDEIAVSLYTPERHDVLKKFVSAWWRDSVKVSP